MIPPVRLGLLARITRIPQELPEKEIMADPGPEPRAGLTYRQRATTTIPCCILSIEHSPNSISIARKCIPIIAPSTSL